MIASHYAEPVERVVGVPATVRTTPSDDADAVAELTPGDPFWLLDDSLGWAWGYAGSARLVGYVESSALSTQLTTEV